MIIRNNRLCTGLALAAAASAMTAPAMAAGTDYLIHIGGVDGESSSATDRGHDKWIELMSLQSGAESAAAGGVNVATGDVDGDGRAGKSGATAQPHRHQPILLRKRVDAGAAPEAPAGPDAIASGQDETAALLLPAVQKVREAAVRMGAWKGCAVGQHIKDAQIRARTGTSVGRILDATVTECGAEEVSFNFTKIEW